VDNLPETQRGDEGASILGPRNDPVDRENLDLLAPPSTDAGVLPNLKFSFGAAHTRLTTGGWTRQVNVHELPVATTLAGVEMRLKPGGIRELHWHHAAEWALMLAGRAQVTAVDPGGMRELHWHPNADEWQYYIAGRARMTVFGAEGTANTFDYQAGDVGYIPFPMGHYIENTGEQPLRFLEMFRSDRYADVSLDQWLALTPPALVRAHLNIDQRTIAAFTKRKSLVVR
jgi:oxalate decarboxylase